VFFTLTQSETKLKAYINGILDVSENIDATTSLSEDSLFIGSTPDDIDKCRFSMFMDEVKLYAGVVPDEEI
jgi:hypothetical protein